MLKINFNIHSKNVKTIGSDTYKGCSSLSTITVDEESNYFKVIDNILFSKGGTKLIRYAPTKMDTFYSVPDDVIEIADHAFEDSSHLESIDILNSDVSIGDYAFRGCTSLTSGKVGAIEWNFDKETGEMTFTGEGEMKTFDSYPWEEIKKSIGIIIISERITTIGESAFDKCSSLTSIIIPDSVTEIGWNVFYECSSLAQGTFGLVEWSLNKETNELKFTGEGKMPNFGSYSATPWYSSKDSIKYIDFSGGITGIGNNAFSGCSSLISVIFPETVVFIGNDAFSWCSSLISVTLSKTILFIGNSAFSKCSNLESPAIPSSVKMIGINAFASCPQWGSGELGDMQWTLNSETGELTFSGSGNMPEFYPGGAPWYPSKLTIKTVDIGDGITSVGSYAFYGCSNLEQVTPPSTVTSIGFNANAKGATIPSTVKRPMLCGMECSAPFSDGVLTIEGSGEMTDFSYSTSLSESRITAPWYSMKSSIKEVRISEGITSIGSYAFYLHSSLSSVNIPNSITKIGNRAFSGCSSLTSINIPSNVKTIGDSAFSGCSELESISVDENNKQYKDDNGVLFTKDMTFLIKYPPKKSDSSYSVPKTVKLIGYGAFNECSL